MDKGNQIVPKIELISGHGSLLKGNDNNEEAKEKIRKIFRR